MDEFKKALLKTAVKYAERMEMMITEAEEIRTEAAVKPEPETGMTTENAEDLKEWMEDLRVWSEKICMDTHELERKIMPGMMVLVAITEAVKDLEAWERGKTGDEIKSESQGKN